MLRPGRVYRLRTPTLGILNEPERVPVTLPGDAVLTVAGPHADSDRMIDVVWQGKTVAMFVIDLRERGEIVDSSSA